MERMMKGLIEYRDKHLDDVCDLADQITKLCHDKDFGLSITAIGSAFGCVVEQAILQSKKTEQKDIKAFIWADAFGLIMQDFGSIARRNSIDHKFTQENEKEHQ